MPLTAIEKKSQFSSLLSHSTGLVVVEFYAAWCGPCKMMAPKFIKVAEQYDKVAFAKVDIDDMEELAADFSINLMPSFVFFKGGKEIHRVEGTKEDDLRAQIEKYQ